MRSSVCSMLMFQVALGDRTNKGQSRRQEGMGGGEKRKACPDRATCQGEAQGVSLTGRFTYQGPTQKQNHTEMESGVS